MLFARVSRGFAVVAIAGGLTLGQVAMSGPAQAVDVVGAATLLTRIAAGGGVGIAAAAPSATATGAMAAICATGAGCAVMAAAAVGIGLYATKDIWVPWVANAFGSAGTPTAVGGQDSCVVVSQQVGYTPGTVNGGIAMLAVAAPTSPKWPGACASRVIWTGKQKLSSGAVVAFDGASAFSNYQWNGATYDPNGDTSRRTVGPFVPTSGASIVEFHGVFTNGAKFDWVSGAEAFDPQTALRRARVSCVRADGTMYEVIGATQNNAGTITMPTCNLPGEEQSNGVGVTLETQAPGVNQPWVTQSTIGGRTAWEVAAAKYPNCVGGSGGCTYVIRVNGLPCTIGGAGCADWPARNEVNPELYECFYGPYSVGMGACALLERAYEPINGTEPITATDPNMDGDPRTSTVPVPAIDPPTSPRVPPAPAPTPVPDPTPCGPGEACGTGPVVGQDCFPSGYGAFNPASWVLQPVKCALSWAFVPSPTFLASWGNGMRFEWGASPPGEWINAVGNIVPVIPGGGCQGPSLSTGFLS